MRIANTVTLNLSALNFQHPLARNKFLETLKSSPFEWLKEMVARMDESAGEDQILTLDLNDPPFAKDPSFRKKAEKIMEALAWAEDPEVRRKAVRSIYANRNALEILLCDTERDIREIAEMRLSGLSTM